MDEEFMNTLRNIGTKWYQCPNGHAYTIGECGLAMVESICPECGEKIGGKDHKLLVTNKLVDFDKDVKNNINITPVKVINKEKEEKINNNNENKKEIINDNKEDEINPNLQEEKNQNDIKIITDNEKVNETDYNKIKELKEKNIQMEKKE